MPARLGSAESSHPRFHVANFSLCPHMAARERENENVYALAFVCVCVCSGIFSYKDTNFIMRV